MYDELGNHKGYNSVEKKDNVLLLNDGGVVIKIEKDGFVVISQYVDEYVKCEIIKTIVIENKFAFILCKYCYYFVVKFIIKYDY